MIKEPWELQNGPVENPFSPEDFARLRRLRNWCEDLLDGESLHESADQFDVNDSFNKIIEEAHALAESLDSFAESIGVKL